jgi:CHRD domain
VRKLLRLTLLGYAGALAIFAGTGATAPLATPTKTTICHHNASAAKPYTKLRLTKAVGKGHQKHASDIIPSRTGTCPTTTLSAESGGRAFTTTLTGSAVVPGPGDSDGTGSATIRLRLGEGRICYQVSVSQITLPASGAQITLDPEAPAGAAVVKLAAPSSEGTASGCAPAARAWSQRSSRNPTTTSSPSRPPTSPTAQFADDFDERRGLTHLVR